MRIISILVTLIIIPFLFIFLFSKNKFDETQKKENCEIYKINFVNYFDIKNIINYEKKEDLIIEEIKEKEKLSEVIEILYDKNIDFKKITKEIEELNIDSLMKEQYKEVLKNYLIKKDEIIDKKIEEEIKELKLNFLFENDKLKKDIIKTSYLYQMINDNSNEKIFSIIENKEERIKLTSELLATILLKETGGYNFDSLIVSSTGAIGKGQINGSTAGEDWLFMLDVRNKIDLKRINVDHIQGSDYKNKLKQIILNILIKENQNTVEKQKYLYNNFINFGNRFVYSFVDMADKNNEIYKKMLIKYAITEEERKKIKEKINIELENKFKVLSEIQKQELFEDKINKEINKEINKKIMIYKQNPKGETQLKKQLWENVVLPFFEFYYQDDINQLYSALLVVEKKFKNKPYKKEFNLKDYLGHIAKSYYGGTIEATNRYTKDFINKFFNQIINKEKIKDIGILQKEYFDLDVITYIENTEEIENNVINEIKNKIVMHVQKNI